MKTLIIGAALSVTSVVLILIIAQLIGTKRDIDFFNGWVACAIFYSYVNHKKKQ